MKNITIPKNKRIKGLYIFCNKCKKIVTDKCFNTNKDISKCPFPEKHVYKAIFHIPGDNIKRKSKILNTRNIDEAIKETLDFEEYLKENNYETTSEVKENNKSELLTDCMAKYIDYLNNQNIPEYQQKLRTTKYIKEIERFFRYFIEVLKINKIEYSKISVKDIDKYIVGKAHAYILEERKFANKTYNKFMGMMRSFFTYLIDIEDYEIKNPFKKVHYKPVNISTETISKKEYYQLLNIIKPENNIQILSTGEKKHHYKPWLKDAIELGAETGRRREEIVSMRFSDIKEDEKRNPIYIEVEDIKVNRAKNNFNKDCSKKIYIPVTKGLKNLLLRMNYNRYRNTDKYILAPEETMERTTMMNFISKGFTHYYKQLNTGLNISFKHLRKTYITGLSIHMGGNARAITQHSNDDVILKHYLNHKIVADVARDFELFKQEYYH